MKRLLSKPALHSVLLYIYVVIGQIAEGIYQTGQKDSPPTFWLAYSVGLPCFLGWWLMQDSRRRGVTWILDLGLFLYIAWPIILPYHLFKTRGLRGLVAIVGFAAVFIGAFVLGALIYLMINPNAFMPQR